MKNIWGGKNQRGVKDGHIKPTGCGFLYFLTVEVLWWNHDAFVCGQVSPWGGSALLRLTTPSFCHLGTSFVCLQVTSSFMSSRAWTEAFSPRSLINLGDTLGQDWANSRLSRRPVSSSCPDTLEAHLPVFYSKRQCCSEDQIRESFTGKSSVRGFRS